MDGRGFEDFGRREIEGFFRRRGERWKFYCASCLATQLTERGAQWVFPATWVDAIESPLGARSPRRYLSVILLPITVPTESGESQLAPIRK